MTLPIVGIACEAQSFEIGNLGSLAHQTVFAQYLESVVANAKVCPILVPAIDGCKESRTEAAHRYAAFLDGLVLPGGASNIDPSLYGASFAESASPVRDAARDATVLPLIRACLTRHIPVLGICRGMQELNVACGGTLTPNVHTVPGRIDHRSPANVPFEEKYHPAHSIALASGGTLEALVRRHEVASDALQVNSLHSQCVDVLGEGLVAEAHAPDGTIEAIRYANTETFALGVQWHLEWFTEEMPLNGLILREFGSACQLRQEQRVAGVRLGECAAS